MAATIKPHFYPLTKFIEILPYVDMVKSADFENYIVMEKLDDDVKLGPLDDDILSAIGAVHLSHAIQSPKFDTFILDGKTFKVGYLRELVDVYLVKEKEDVIDWLYIEAPSFIEYIDIDRLVLDLKLDRLKAKMVDNELYTDANETIVVYRIK